MRVNFSHGLCRRLVTTLIASLFIASQTCAKTVELHAPNVPSDRASRVTLCPHHYLVLECNVTNSTTYSLEWSSSSFDTITFTSYPDDGWQKEDGQFIFVLLNKKNDSNMFSFFSQLRVNASNLYESSLDVTCSESRNNKATISIVIAGMLYPSTKNNIIIIIRSTIKTKRNTTSYSYLHINRQIGTMLLCD